MSDTQVLIAGAGAIVLALWLSKQGVKVHTLLRGLAAEGMPA